MPHPLGRTGPRTSLLLARRRTRRRIAAWTLISVVGATVLGIAAWMALAAAAGSAAGSGPSVAPVEVPAARGSGMAGVLPTTSAETTALTATSASEPVASAAEASRPATLTVSAVGDMIFDRRVAALIRSQGGEAPLLALASRLRRADVALGNLESVLSSRGTRDADKDVTFRGDPRGAAGLRLAGFDFISLANNHVLDYGPVALADTVALLDRNGIRHAGAGVDRSAAWKPAVVERRGASVAFLSFSHVLPTGFVATRSRPGLAAGRGNMDEVTAAIRRAKQRDDYVVVSFHWGVEYADDANGDQVRDARRAIDAGADMVLSHHPHVIQGVEFYKRRLIAYSLGDFVFDHYSRRTGEAFVLEASMGPDGITGARAVPVYLDEHGRPEVVRGSAARAILGRLETISAKHGTRVVGSGDTARLLP